MRTEYSLFHRRLRFRCSKCGARTVWFYSNFFKKYPDETVESWRVWWTRLHEDVVHNG